MKRANIIPLLVTAMAALFLTATSCGAKRNVQAENMNSSRITSNVSAFDKVDSNVPMTLTLTQGKKTKVEYIDPKGVVKIVKVSDNVLHIIMDKNKGVDCKDVRFYITTADLKDLQVNAPLVANVGKMKLENLNVKVNGPASVEVEELTCKNLAIKMNGPSRVEGNIKGGTVAIDHNGPASTSLNVETEKCSIKHNGPASSDVTYKGQDAQITLNGPGHSIMDVDCEKLRAVCNGPGCIEVKGTADRSEIKLNGVGSIDTSQLNKI